MVAGVLARDASALVALYQSFRHSVRFYLLKHVGRGGADDLLHDGFLVLVDAIQSRALRDPSKLIPFAFTTVRRLTSRAKAGMWEQREALAKARKATPPRSVFIQNTAETEMLAMSRTRAVAHFIEELNPKHREVVERFFLQGQSIETICVDTGLTPKQVQQIKWRAKQRLIKLCHHRGRGEGLGSMPNESSQTPPPCATAMAASALAKSYPSLLG